MGQRATDGERLEVLILHSEISPYRVPLFSAIGGHVDLDVAFCTRSGADRLWDESLDSHTEFRGFVLENVSVASLVVNSAVLSEVTVTEYDVIILDDDPRITVARTALAIAAKHHDIPTVLWTGKTLRGYDDRLNQLGDRLLSPLQRLVYRLADHFVAYSQDSSIYLQERGVHPTAIETGTQAIAAEFRGSVDCDLRNQLQETFRPDDCVFMYLGYFSERKGVQDLIDAFRRIRDTHANLVVAGAGEFEDHLRERAGDDDRIRFPGYLSDPEKAAFLDVVDVFILPSYNDPWGLVINEAMLFELPIVTTDAVGAREMVSDNGIIVEAGNVEALERALRCLLNDPSLRREMGERSTKIVQQYDIESATERFLTAIDAVRSRRQQ